MIRSYEDHLAHYGILRRSGRYPWGSGDTQSKRNKSFLDITREQKKQGLSDTEIAKGHGITTTEYRAAKSIALAQQRQEKQLTAQRLKEKGWSNQKIGERMGGLNESSVRALLAAGEKDKSDALQTTANMLKVHVDEKGMIDVGKGVEHQIGVNKSRLDTSVAVLKEQGYTVHNIKIQQIGTGKFTTMKVLAKPGTPLSYVQQNRRDIKQITSYSNDQGRSFMGTQPPISISSKRIKVNYGEDGGAKADGMIYIRPGVKKLDMGSNRYSQVRIAVDDTHFLKGMAVYKDDIPDGYDIVFNTKKENTGRKKDVMKEMNKDDPENPFGAIVRQVHGPDGKVTSALNMVGAKEGAGEEGSWDTWSRNLSAQTLSKQSPKLAQQQLDLTFERRRKELDEINSLTNPTVRKELLTKFADSTDAASVHLKAASLPKQATKVLIPVQSMKPTEIHAPGFKDGERVVLIRYPHGGTFEIPELTVNNRNREAGKVIGRNAKDAVGIHHTVAQHLSGADFDGDTVLVIPNNKKLIEHTPALEGLKDFDPMVYKIPKDSSIPRMTSTRKQQEMGKVSNLITDMTLQGAGTDKIARAIKHSMVVIDAEKHELDFLQSEKDHGILALKEEYQGGKRAGAQTLISRKKSEVFLPERELRSPRRGGPIDPVTGKKVFELTGRMVPERKPRTNPVTGRRENVLTGKMVPKKVGYKKLELTDDALTLSSGTRMEAIYAEHSNRLKAMANQARKESVSIKGEPYSPSARKVYAKEVESLDSKIRLAERNAPFERQAQLLANDAVGLKRQANPNMEKEEVKKIKQQALNVYRNRTGASKTKIILTQSEWDAIQAGAISPHKLGKILTNGDLDNIKQLAMPKHTPKLSSTELRRAQSMEASGYTQQEIADHLGIGLTTLKVGLSE